jgi:hypothetical protein
MFMFLNLLDIVYGLRNEFRLVKYTVGSTPEIMQKCCHSFYAKKKYEIS